MKKIFPHIFVGICFIILVMMGTWQVQRLQWKNELMAKINSNINQPPIAPGEFKNIEDDEFKTMTVTGKFDHNKEINLLGKQWNGKPGFHVVVPITGNGETIIVNRGWVESEGEPVRPVEEQTITGVIRASQKRNFVGRQIILENVPERKEWFWIDLPAVYKTVGAPEKTFYLEVIAADDEKPKFYPYPLPRDVKLYNEHLQYAITWYSLALVLLGVYYFRFRKSNKSL